MPVRTRPVDQLIPHERLLSLLSYDSATGDFTRLTSRGGCRAGEIATGYIDRHGYRLISVDGLTYQAARLAWFYVHGTWPEGEVDHKDRDTLNNRIDNLRDAHRRLQRANQKVRSDSKCGFKGVRWHKGNKKWQARFARKSIGYFDTPELAHEAYMRHARAVFGDYARSA